MTMSERWVDEVFDGSLRIGLKVKEQLFDAQSDYQRVEIFDSEGFGRVLTLDGLFMTSERDEFVYHELVTHPALCSAPQVRKVLVVGGGDGGCVREVLRHQEVESVTLVEIDPVVIEASKRFLPGIGSCWEHPKFKLEVEDGVAFLEQQAPGSFDVIILDSTDPVGPGEGLFNRSFYESCKRALSPEGVLALQSESPFLMEKLFVEIQRVLREVFPKVAPYFANVPIYGSALWSWTLASATVPLPKKPNIERLRAIEAELRYYNADIHDAVFAQPNYIRKLLA